MIFCFSNYQNYSLVLFYFNVMFKWAFPFNRWNLNFTWGMRIIIMANTHTCMNYPIEIWHIMKLCSLGFLFLFGSHLLPKFPQLKRKCAWLKPAVMARSRWLTERAFVDEPKIETSLVPGWLIKQAQPTLSGLGKSGDLMRSTIMICYELLSCLSKQVLFSLSIPFYLQL